MKFGELFREKEFTVVFEEVSHFAQNLLADYNARLRKSGEYQSEKEIFDAVWGNIEFSSGEICILDSPLLQRLRKIKQLGLAHYVYCGCDYSRFYHTLGVVFLADKMARSINKSLPDYLNNPDEKDYFRQIVRIAALFHDAGHMFMSHVSEQYFAKSPRFKRCEEIARMLQKFGMKTGGSVSLHELISCMLVNTDSVRKLLQESGGYLETTVPHQGQDFDRYIDYISCLIVGSPLDRKILPYSKIINGPVDADKCDYLSRDSYATHVPVAVDMSRLTSKMSVVKVDDIYQSELWDDGEDPGVGFYEMAMMDSAEKTLFQLSIARSMMFDSVYYHQKVLTVETEFRSLIHELAELNLGIFDTFDSILKYTDGEIGDHFFEYLKLKSPDQKMEIEGLQSKARRIYDRCLDKRVACLLPNYLIGAQSHTEVFLDKVLTVLDSNGSVEFVEQIRREYVQILDLLGEEKCPAEENVEIALIQTPGTGHNKIKIYIDLKNGSMREYRGADLINSKETSNASAYVITNQLNRGLVYLALEKTLKEHYDISLKQECGACCKYEKKEQLEKARKLWKSGYFDRVPELIPDELVYNAISPGRIKGVAERFQVYEGEWGHVISAKGILHFLKQNMALCRDKRTDKMLLEGIVRLIEHAVFIDRKHFDESMVALFQDIEKSDKPSWFIPMGNDTDSGKHMAYYLNDVKQRFENFQSADNLKDALKKGEARLCFFDDGAYSGKQLVSIFQEYMGVPAEQRVTQESHVKPLNKKERASLQKREIHFLFMAFNQSNALEIKRHMEAMGLSVQISFVHDMSEKYLESGGKDIFMSEEQRQCVKRHLQMVGQKIMEGLKRRKDGSYEKNWPKERIDASALGYNDAQQMVILKSSVPTYTITPFWAEIESADFTWKPLFLRTKK